MLETDETINIRIKSFLYDVSQKLKELGKNDQIALVGHCNTFKRLVGFYLESCQFYGIDKLLNSDQYNKEIEENNKKVANISQIMTKLLGFSRIDRSLVPKDAEIKDENKDEL